MVSRLNAFFTTRAGLVRIAPTSTRNASSVIRVKAYTAAAPCHRRKQTGQAAK